MTSSRASPRPVAYRASGSSRRSRSSVLGVGSGHLVRWHRLHRCWVGRDGARSSPSCSGTTKGSSACSAPAAARNLGQREGHPGRGSPVVWGADHLHRRPVLRQHHKGSASACTRRRNTPRGAGAGLRHQRHGARPAGAGRRHAGVSARRHDDRRGMLERDPRRRRPTLDLAVDIKDGRTPPRPSLRRPAPRSRAVRTTVGRCRHRLDVYAEETAPMSRGVLRARPARPGGGPGSGAYIDAVTKCLGGGDRRLTTGAPRVRARTDR